MGFVLLLTLCLQRVPEGMTRVGPASLSEDLPADGAADLVLGEAEVVLPDRGSPNLKPEALEPALGLSAPPAMMRAEFWRVEFFAGARANQWAMFGASHTIVSGQNRWNLKVDDTVGAGGSLAVHLSPYSFETYFDYNDAVLTTADHLTIRTWGANFGWDIFGNEWERFAGVMGPLVLYPNMSFVENQVSIPGRLERSTGGQWGCRYTRDISEGRIDAPKIGFSAEAYFRYAPLRFAGDPGIPNKSIGGAGIVLSLGFYVRF